MRRCRPRSLLFAALASCSGDDEPPAPEPSIPYETLSEYGFFEGALADLEPRQGVVAYTVVSSLWADHAGKSRFLVPPPDGAIGFDAGEEWRFPLGTIVVKTFFAPDDLRDPEGPRWILETRLLILEDEGWTGHTYVWDDGQTEARRTIAGQRLTISNVGEDGAPNEQEYLVPNTTQCGSCHERDDEMRLLGVIGPQLRRPIEVLGETVDQLEWLEEQGLFDAPLPDLAGVVPLSDPFGDDPVDARARGYLHANCSHCHRAGGGGGSSGLVLLAWETDPEHNGVCKVPAAAGSGTGGRPYDIVPGEPEQSIMLFRMASTDPDVKMPELPNRLPDDAGIALVTEWIAEMTPVGCSTE